MTPTDLDPSQWSGLFSSCLSASATLTGLLFVAVSINLDRVVGNNRLLARAGETLIGLTLLLVFNACLLVRQSRVAAAIEVVAIAAVVAAATLRAQLHHGPDSPIDPWWWFAVRIATVQVVTLPTAIGGISMLAGGGGGLRWIATGQILGFVLATYSAWVLLVEVVRQSASRKPD